MIPIVGSIQKLAKKFQADVILPRYSRSRKIIMNAMIVDDLRRSFVDPAVGMAYIYCNFNRQHEQGINDIVTRLIMQPVTGRYGITPLRATLQ